MSESPKKKQKNGGSAKCENFDECDNLITDSDTEETKCNTCQEKQIQEPDNEEEFPCPFSVEDFVTCSNCGNVWDGYAQCNCTHCDTESEDE